MATTNKNRYDYLKSLIEENINESFSTAVSLLPPSLQTFFPTPTQLSGEDPAPLINPNKIGTLDAINTPVYQKTKIDLRSFNKQQVLELVKQGKLIEIGDANKNPKYFAKGMTTTNILEGKYYLEKKTAQQFFLWYNEMQQRNIPFLISSAIRFGANTGGGPHGYGIAVDFSNLYQLVQGSTNSTINKNARIKYSTYKQIAEIGAKYGFYNPWRLSDNSGVDELWHFEYWGPA
jgi:hypothetical protein